MIDQFWEQFLSFLKSQQKHQFLANLLKQTKPLSLTQDSLSLGCENSGLQLFLEKKKKELEMALFNFSQKKIRIEFSLVSEKKKKKQDPPLFLYESSITNLLEKANLNEKYSFENFAVSSSNQVAFAAAQAVAENPGHAYNPLFLYGTVGVGKTHLACAIARKIIEKRKSEKVYFCPGDQFTNELIDSIRNKTTNNFRKKYRYLDLLCIDDIQFIAGKQTVQEEFFHTFNAIVGHGGQIVLISDQPPTMIKNLEDRLRSRFSGGLIVDIQPPDFELRAAILLIKAKEKAIDIDINAARVIAEQITDTRALEGTLLSIYAKMINQNPVKKTIDLEEVEGFFLNSQREKTKRVIPEDVIKTVASYYAVKVSQIKGKGRTADLALARQVIMYILREKLKLRLKQIAYILKREDHTTIIHGVEKILHLIAKNPQFKDEVDTIIKNLSL
jgi:chromosomal replication initiator protein